MKFIEFSDEDAGFETSDVYNAGVNNVDGSLSKLPICNEPGFPLQCWFDVISEVDPNLPVSCRTIPLSKVQKCLILVDLG